MKLSIVRIQVLVEKWHLMSTLMTAMGKTRKYQLKVKINITNLTKEKLQAKLEAAHCISDLL